MRGNKFLFDHKNLFNKNLFNNFIHFFIQHFYTFFHFHIHSILFLLAYLLSSPFLLSSFIHRSMSHNGRVLVYGGRGALGAALVEHFRAKNVWVLNVDLNKNDSAHSNIVVDPMHCWMEQETRVLNGVESTLAGEKLDAILCVAGGWAGGNAANKDLIKNADLMWHQSVWSSAISAKIGAKFLKPGGLMQFTGAAAATHGTPGMIGYGMAKAAVHQLVMSLGDWKAAGLPDSAVAFALLPVTLDTPMNRKWMPDANHSTWTPLSFIADKLHSWAFEVDKASEDRPKPGSLLKLSTKEGETKISVVGEH